MPFPTGSFWGRHQQGTELPLVVQCVDADGAPADPTDYPRVSVYRDGASPTLVETVKVAADQRGVAVGLFRTPHFLGGLYGTPGRHLAVVKYTDPDGVAHHETAAFVLLPGGSPDGAVISLQYVERPDSTYLLYQTDAGRLIRGRNPR